LPQGLQDEGIKVVIGAENKAEAIKNYSVVVRRYGLPDEATGTIGVVGPTRMQYARNLAVVNYFSTVLSELVGELYGRKFESKGADSQ